ncbi:MAG: ATP-binding protein [Gemmatimonadota bacterium]|nr:ATP-binding protein [Gemmatimonadota bacterium]
MRRPHLSLSGPSAITVAQVISALTIAYFLDSLFRGQLSGTRGDVLICIQLGAAAVACGRGARRFRGTRRLLFVGIAAAAALSLVGRGWYTLHEIWPGTRPMSVTFEALARIAAQLCLGLGLTAALGRRRGRLQLEPAMDALLLVTAAAMVTVQLNYVPEGGGPAYGAVRTISIVWNALSAINLVLLALLLAWRGEFLGTRTAVGIALGTLALTTANMLYSRAVIFSGASIGASIAILWSVATLGYVTAVSTGSTPPADLTGEMPTFARKSKVRVISIVVAILIASGLGLSAHVTGDRSLALGVTIGIFGIVLAMRTGYALWEQQQTTRHLEHSVVAEREVSTTLEQRVSLRTHELAEAQRVLERMWALAQQIALELNRDRVLQRFVAAVVEVVQAEAGAVGLLTETRDIEIATSVGLDPLLTRRVIQADNSAMGRVIRSGDHWWSEDVQAPGSRQRLAEADFSTDFPMHGIAVVPLRRGGERIGAVAVFSLPQRRFTTAELSYVAAMGDLLSVALANADLVQTLRKTESRFRTLFRAAPDAVLTVLEDGRIREANDAVKDIIDLPASQVIGRTLEEFVAPDDRDRLRYELADALDGMPTRVEIRFPHARGMRLVALAARLVPDAQPRTVLFVGRDITGEREMRARLAETERLAAVGELVAGVAHEVNNPLSTISAFAQLLLKEEGFSEDQRESLSVIQGETIRASQVLRDLLTFARRSEGGRQPVQINELVERSLRLRSYEMTKNGVRTELSLQPSLPSVIADGRQLQQVVLNLVSNAVQAMAPSGGGTLSIRSAVDGDRVVLEVRDSGPGVPDSARDHIFEPFFTTKPDGTGLGLSVSYGIVTAHGGDISIADTSTLGTTFRIELPMSDQTVENVAAVSLVGGSLLKGIRLLFVDDESALRAGVAAFARLRRFTAITVGDGEAALAALHEAPFDAVVSDLRMPGMDGIALFGVLTRDHPDLATRTVFVTGDVMSPSTRDFIQATTQPVLTKPFEFEQLEEALVTVLRPSFAAGHPVRRTGHE